MMHYFKFDIATRIQSTRHLTPEEEGVYLRLVNHYYDTEKPLPVEIQPVLKRLQLRGHLDLVNEILTDFFVLTHKGWSHNKCNELLKEYHKGAKKNKLNGQKGGRPSKTKASSVTQKEPSGFITETQTEPKHNPNYELVTKNEELITTNDKLSIKDLFDSFWSHSNKRGDKKKAHVYFVKIINKKDNPEDFTQFLIDDMRKRKDAGQMGFDQMHITTYLNGERFDDEIQSGEPNEPNRYTKPSKETAIERMARKQKAMDARDESPRHYEEVLGQNDSVISTQIHEQ
jgi:uncharacterized protein YdaU (DUF1376 family)